MVPALTLSAMHALFDDPETFGEYMRQVDDEMKGGFVALKVALSKNDATTFADSLHSLHNVFNILEYTAGAQWASAARAQTLERGIIPVYFETQIELHHAEASRALAKFKT